jgi:hypothetical protein
MIFAIPNPKKELVVQFPISQVQKSLSNMSAFLKESGKGNYIQDKFDPVLNQLILMKTEFLSLGVKIVIDCSYVSDSQTKISIEIQRAVGSFDQAHEVSNANKHMEVISEGFSKLLSNPNYEPKEESKPMTEEQKEKASSEMTGVLLGGIVMAIIFWMIAH